MVSRFVLWWLPLDPFGALEERVVIEALYALVLVDAWGLVAGSVIVEIEAHVQLGPSLFRRWWGFVCCR